MESHSLFAAIILPEFQTYIDLGFFQLRYYSLAYIFGLLFAWWFIRRQCTKPGAPMSLTHIDDFFFWGAMGVIIGGRLGYVFFYNFQQYLYNPLDIFKVWDGGMSFHGGLVGVVLAVILFCRKHKLDLMRVADIVAVVSPMGLLLGRLANFINGELWGRAVDGSLSWGMVFPRDSAGLVRHPSQLYEAALEGLLLLIVLQLLYHFTDIRKKAGLLAGLFFAGYGLSRFTVEFFREPDQHLGLSTMLGIEISRGQLLTVPMLLFAVWLMRQGFKRNNT